MRNQSNSTDRTRQLIDPLLTAHLVYCDHGWLRWINRELENVFNLWDDVFARTAVDERDVSQAWEGSLVESIELLEPLQDPLRRRLGHLLGVAQSRELPPLAYPWMTRDEECTIAQRPRLDLSHGGFDEIVIRSRYFEGRIRDEFCEFWNKLGEENGGGFEQKRQRDGERGEKRWPWGEILPLA